MSKYRLSSWMGGVVIGAALAGGAVVVAQPQLSPDRVGEKPVDSVSAIQEFSNGFRAVAKEVTPAVVSIEARTSGRRIEGQTQFRGDERGFEGMLPPGFRGDPRLEEMLRQFGQQPGMTRFVPPQQSKGSGVIIDSSGVILTNSHVVSGADEVTVRLSDGREFLATDIRTDERSDVAVVKIDANDLVPAAVGDSDEVQVGDWVMAIGSPFGLDTTVTAGIISGKERGPGINEREGFLQTDAAINPGNSGGPLVNLNGQVIGINTAISSRGGGNDGVGFAIPINMANWIATQLLEKGNVQRSYLGVSIQPLTGVLAEGLGVESEHGVVVTHLFPDTPAAKSKLQVGDVITGVDGEAVRSPLQLQLLVERLEAGKEVDFQVVREGEEIEVPIAVAVMPGDYGQENPSQENDAEPKQDSKSYDHLGLEVGPISPEAAEQLGYEGAVSGVVVTGVEPGSPAEDAGLKRGVVIERVGKTKISSVEDFTKAIDSLGDDASSVVLLVRTPNGWSFVTPELK